MVGGENGMDPGLPEQKIRWENKRSGSRAVQHPSETCSSYPQGCVFGVPLKDSKETDRPIQSMGVQSTGIPHCSEQELCNICVVETGS